MQAIRFAGDRPLAVRTFPALRLVVAFVAHSAADEGPTRNSGATSHPCAVERASAAYGCDDQNGGFEAN
jgi:hypothetical protein